MRFKTIFFIVALAVLMLAGIAWAGDTDSKKNGLTGGLTIGGPGIFSRKSDAFEVIHVSESPRILCVTLVGEKGTTQASFDMTPDFVVVAGETSSVCRDEVVSVEIQCAGGSCKAEWRVDTVPMADVVQGPEGPEGPQGPRGPEGPQGQEGPVAVPDVLVEVVGVEGLQGPKGDKGDKGNKGDEGDKGDEGVEGPQGPAGTSCWDLDQDTICDAEEDVNDPSGCDALDCLPDQTKYVPFYSGNPACGIGGELALTDSCQRILCRTLPSPLFFRCDGSCGVVSIDPCDNILIGYLIGP